MPHATGLQISRNYITEFNAELTPNSSGGSKNSEQKSVLRMERSIVENVPTPQESIFNISLTSQLPYIEKKVFEFSKLRIFLYFLYQPTLGLLPINEI